MNGVLQKMKVSFFTLNEITGACVVCNEKICIRKVTKKNYFAILISVSSSLISHFHFILLFRMIHQPFCKPAYQDAIPTRSDVKSDVTVTQQSCIAVSYPSLRKTSTLIQFSCNMKLLSVSKVKVCKSFEKTLLGIRNDNAKKVVDLFKEAL